MDCPPPSFSATDATLDNLRAVSPDLVFDRLTITGELDLGNPRGREVYILANSISFGSNSEISWSQGTCDYFDAPDLVLEAVDTAELIGYIGLRGKSGVSSLSSATCNDCTGTDGGSLVVSATNIRLAGLHDLAGGQSSNSRVTFPGGSVTVACDGADGGALELLAQNEVEVASRAIQNGGKGGLGEFGSDDDGDLGQKGQFLISGPPEQLIRFVERDDANALQTSAQRVPFKPLTINGQIESNRCEFLSLLNRRATVRRRLYLAAEAGTEYGPGHEHNDLHRQRCTAGRRVGARGGPVGAISDPGRLRDQDHDNSV
ncbi:MAG: hypothetical protein AAFQ65_09550 [Myxococcota bacterium]